MNKNNTFCLRRLWMLVRWDFGTNWKVYAFRYLGLYLGFLAMMVLYSFLLPSASPGYEEVYTSSVVSVCFFLFMILSFRSASFVMERMYSKEGRVTFLMLPASRLEKFVWRAFFASVLFLLAGVVAFALADLTNYLLCLSFDELANLPPRFYVGDYMRCLRCLVSNSVLHADDVVISGHSSLPRWFYSIHSFGHLVFAIFVLGGCCRPRWAGIGMLAGLLLIVWGAPKLLDPFTSGEVVAIYAPSEWIDGVSCLLTILCWVLAYRFFLRSQIV